MLKTIEKWTNNGARTIKIYSRSRIKFLLHNFSQKADNCFWSAWKLNAVLPQNRMTDLLWFRISSGKKSIVTNNHSSMKWIIVLVWFSDLTWCHKISSRVVEGGAGLKIERNFHWMTWIYCIVLKTSITKKKSVELSQIRKTSEDLISVFLWKWKI